MKEEVGGSIPSAPTRKGPGHDGIPISKVGGAAPLEGAAAANRPRGVIPVSVRTPVPGHRRLVAHWCDLAGPAITAHQRRDGHGQFSGLISNLASDAELRTSRVRVPLLDRIGQRGADPETMTGRGGVEKPPGFSFSDQA